MSPLDVAAAGSIIYVDADATGYQYGTSWANAYTDLQSALDAATSGDQIWVAEGTYKPTKNAYQYTSSFRAAAFSLVNGVAMYGGFDPGGGDDSFAERDRFNNLTTLSGDIGALGNSTDNAYYVVYSSNLDYTTIIDGFKITEGSAASPAWAKVAGMYNLRSSPQVRNCRFWSNYGYGMRNDYSSPTVTECSFWGNADSGMYNDSSSPTVINCYFVSNSSTDSGGGGMLNEDSSSPTVTNCTFYWNAGGIAHGIGYSGSSLLTLTNCILWENGPDEIILSANAVVRNCNVKGGVDGTDNIDADPKLVDPANGYMGLKFDSPCIDRGANSVNRVSIPVTDWDGESRPYDGDGDGIGLVDIGADEYHPWHAPTPTPTPTPQPTTTPTITVNPKSGARGTLVTATGSGWLPGALGIVTITLNGQTMAIAQPDANGDIWAQFNAPSTLSPGVNYAFMASDNNGNTSAVGTYSVLVSLTTPTPPASLKPTPTPTPEATPTSAAEDSQDEFPLYLLGAGVGGVLLVAGLLGVYSWRKRRKPSVPRWPIGAEVLPPELEPLYDNASFIGAGGFARVYRARRRSDGKEVAVKVPERLDAQTGEVFLAEISSWQRLSHRNIVELYGRNVYPLPHLEMEFCPDSLEGLPKPMDVGRAAGMVFHIAEGLKYAHSQGVVHRDLKPHNILVKDEVPKIVDWGLSKVVAESKGSSLAEGHTFSLYWAAPEQLAREKFGKPDHRTDIYQLGAVFYELVTGELPFKGDSITEIMGAILTEEAAPPSSVNPEAGPVDAIILKCIQKRMEDRYQSVEELQRDLADYLQLEYKESLKKSRGDMKRSGYYCSELCLVHLRMGEVGEALKYAVDLNNYAGEQVKADLASLITELEYRSKEGVGIAEELIERAAIVLHQARMGR